MSHSNGENFRVSSFCANSAAHCVEVAALSDGQVRVRDGKNPGGPTHTFTSAEWQAFVAGVKNGEFDHF